MPLPKFDSTQINIPCYSTNPVTIALNPYVNTESNDIDKGMIITSHFEWTLPSGWRTTTGQTGTFVDGPSISVIPPASTSATSISVRAEANLQHSNSATLQITRELEDLTITGYPDVVYNSIYRYEVPFKSGVSYSWQLPTGWSGSSTTNYIDVTTGCSTGVLTCIMSACGLSKTASMSITSNVINPLTTIYLPSDLCSSEATLFINNLPPVNSIIWECSPNLNISSQDLAACTFTIFSSGNSWVRAKLVTNCGNIYTLPQRDFYVGDPYYTFLVTRPDGYPVSRDEFGDPTFCPYTDYEFWVDWRVSGCNTAGQIWDIPSAWTVNYNNGAVVSINTNDSPNEPIAVEVVNLCCGKYFTLSQSFGNSTTCDLYLLSITPNPSAGETTLSIGSKTAQKVDALIEWDLEVYDSMQALKIKTQKIKGDQQILNTSGWKDGVYIVRAKVGDILLSEKLVVKH